MQNKLMELEAAAEQIGGGAHRIYAVIEQAESKLTIRERRRLRGAADDVVRMSVIVLREITAIKENINQP